MPETDLDALISYNQLVLQQAGAVVSLCNERGLDYEQFVGPHVRHIIEHYEALIAPNCDGVILYDARKRDRLVEKSAALATARIESLVAALSTLRNTVESGTTYALFKAGVAGEFEFVVPSSLTRELLFLSHHAVHHYALIRLHFERQGIPVAADFGYAPATIAYTNREAA